MRRELAGINNIAITFPLTEGGKNMGQLWRCVLKYVNM